MSKAFIKETDHEEEENDLSAPAIPGGAKNYITPAGLRRMQEELYQLKHVERPKVCEVVSWAAGNGDRSENADYQYGKRRLREIDKRTRFLGKRLDNVEVVDPLLIKQKDQVMIGATVTIADEDGAEKRYSIVGVDETDLEKGRVSWASPIGTALLKAREGDWVTVRTPKGPRDVEVLKIEYVEID
jgi:transcription elongation factor GreB